MREEAPQHQYDTTVCINQSKNEFAELGAFLEANKPCFSLGSFKAAVLPAFKIVDPLLLELALDYTGKRRQVEEDRFLFTVILCTGKANHCVSSSLT